MKILEIKNNLVKIAYDVEDNLAISGFVIIEDSNNPYVAQVMNVKADSISNTAIVKLLFTFNEEGILKNYNGTIPSLSSSVSKLPSKELLDIIPSEDPIILGLLAQQGISLKVDKSIFENNLLVCSNNTENTLNLLNNISSQVNEKIVIFDTDNVVDIGKKVTFGKDFRIPLNYGTIEFLYENELEDVDAVSRAVVQDVFIEVQEYIKTLPERYLPFSTFLNVVDAQYKETQIPQLALLKNKLRKYNDINAFAENLKDILNLSIAIDQNDVVVVDLSDISEALQKEVIMYAYDVMKGINENIYVFAKLNNSIANKKLVKKCLERSNVFTSIICPHEFKYLPQVKENAQNVIFFAPMTLQHDFASYNTFLNKLNADEFVIYGAHTQNIPLIVECTDFDSVEEEFVEEKTEEKVPKEETLEEEILEQDTVEEEVVEDDFDEVLQGKNSEEEALIEESEELVEDELVSEEEYPEINYPQIEDLEDEEPSQENVEESFEDLPEEESEEELLVEEEIEIHELSDDDDDVIEPEESPVEEEYIEEETNIVEPLTHDEMVEQAAKDIDKAMYEKIPEEELIIDTESIEESSSQDELEEISADEVEDIEDTQENSELMEENFSEEDLTEDDLNLIDDLADGAIPLIEPENDEPLVPVYPAEDLEPVAPVIFEPGDKVSTPKFGEGVVEKMVKYGNKTLCSIMFPNIGRRLLDPAMAEITKL